MRAVKSIKDLDISISQIPIFYFNKIRYQGYMEM